MARRKSYTTLGVTLRNAVGIVAMNRPEVHNAFNEVVIAELTEAARDLEKDESVRVVVLAGNGPSFCAGADLNWMKKMAGYSRDQNLADAAGLAEMLRTWNELRKPTVARVHGAAYGGGVGLVACCDIAIAAAEATFALSESKLGLIPSTISPYVIEAIGARYVRRYFLSAERFEAAEAYRIGLVHDIVPIAQLDDRVNEMLGSLLTAGPDAQRECKALIRAVAGKPIDKAVIADTVQRIAAVRAAPEGKEGVAAFLGKRAAEWIPAELRKK
ncbi:MAG TPA: enoyl-CoA hydratase/isomerase family protein [Casimicrobiaceae bacterium]|nr:enoyl-CoA hydratase/isomerase family protein [Casimicrobiaceae bacterium]